MKVECDIEEVDMEGDYGLVDGVIATCSRCGHQTESYGVGDGSRRRCMVIMSNECPEDESNFYYEAE